MATKKLAAAVRFAQARKEIVAELAKLQTKYTELDEQIDALQDIRIEVDDQMGDLENLLEGYEA